MKGKIDVLVKDARIQYKFTLKRNITILRGDSATGKTTLIDMIRLYNRSGKDSGVEIRCSKKCIAVYSDDYKYKLSENSDSIIFIDEGSDFVTKKEFADMVRGSDNYFVIAVREPLSMLPYSINEIYGIRNKSGNRYQGTKRLYSEFYPLNKTDINSISKPDLVIVEDEKSGFEFWSSVFGEYDIECVPAKGKSNIFTLAASNREKTVLVISDGAAFGSEIGKLMELKEVANLILYMPESFEWLILKADLTDDKDTRAILSTPEEYADSKDYFSWEQFFTALLIDKTKDTYLAYSKDKLNPSYLRDKEKHEIMKNVPEIRA